jgi:hypothetical protein
MASPAAAEPPSPALTVVEPAAATRKKTGGAAHLTQAERREIQLVHLEEGLNQSQLAARFGRTREAIAKALKGEDFDALQRQVHDDLGQRAKARLAGGVEKAAAAWVRSVEVAADKGDHKAAKDLLLHTGVIEPIGDARGANVAIAVVNMPGQTKYRAEDFPVNEIVVSPDETSSS